jgi:hypothetical protein
VEKVKKKQAEESAQKAQARGKKRAAPSSVKEKENNESGPRFAELGFLLRYIQILMFRLRKQRRKA